MEKQIQSFYSLMYVLIPTLGQSFTTSLSLFFFMLSFLFGLLHAQPCPATSPSEQILLSSKSRKEKQWTSTQIIPNTAHLRFETTHISPSSILIRTSSTKEGYEVQLTHSSVQIFRKEQKKKAPISTKIYFPKPTSSASIHLLQKKAAMELWVCEKEHSLAHFRWEDTAFPDGLVHLESEEPLFNTQISYTSQSKMMEAIWPHDILGTSALLAVQPNEDLPPLIQNNIIKKAREPGLWSVIPKREQLPNLLPYKNSILSISKYMPYWAINSNPKHQPPQELEEHLVEISTKHNAALHQIGISRQGHPIWAIQLNKENSKKPSVLFVGGVQGNDTRSIHNTLNQLTRLLDTNDGLIQLWKQKLDLWFVPLLNVDGSYFFWYHNIYAGDVAPWDTDENGQIEWWEGTNLQHNTSALFLQSPRETRGLSPHSAPALQHLFSLAQHISPSLSFSWMEHTEQDGISKTLSSMFGTKSVTLDPEKYTDRSIESELNQLIAGPAIRIIVSDSNELPIEAHIHVKEISTSKWKSRKDDGLWIHPVEQHSTYTLTIHALSYKKKTIRVQTNRLYHIKLQKEKP